ncbi:MAG: DNA polymerase IV [Actinobacteria bacterium]|nr:DNA polymerase IV [Actinomycetota bacterium]
MWAEPILHVDMDSFFVEVERRRNPSLRGVPVAVGGVGPRGVIASASYEARRNGVSSAQPTAMALKSCPSLVVVPPDHGLYSEVSAQVFAIFRTFTPRVEGLSLDEAFLDVQGLRRHHPSPGVVAEEVRRRLRSGLGLPASVGIASNKMLAKLASEAAKPDGLRHIPASDQLEFLHALPASSLWGVGPATLASLQRLGVATVGDIAGIPEQTLMRHLGPASGRHLHELAQGHDPRGVEADTEAKSISVEETYSRDLEGRAVLESSLLAHAQRLSGRLRRAGLAGRTITLKVRFDDFRTVTRSHTAERACDGSREIYREAIALLDHLEPERPVRLLGLGASMLEERSTSRQLELGDDGGWKRVEEAVAGIRERFGDQAVGPARLARPGEERG